LKPKGIFDRKKYRDFEFVKLSNKFFLVSFFFPFLFGNFLLQRIMKLGSQLHRFLVVLFLSSV